MQASHYAPPPGNPLRPFVYGIWQICVARSHWRQRVLPRGIVDLMFPLKGQLTLTQAHTNDLPIIHDAAFVAGLQSRAVSSEATGGLVMLGVNHLRSALVLTALLSELTTLTPVAQMTPR